MPPAPQTAQALVETVYGQMKRDFGLVACPITLHRPVPELLAASWSTLRETVVADGVDRAAKETVASTISQLNGCPYCVDAHVVMLGAVGKRDVQRAIDRHDYDAIPYENLRALAHWAAATRTPDAAELLAPPFGPAEAPELIGTAVYFHYVNRMVSLFCDESPFGSTNRLLRASLVRIGGRRFRDVALEPHAAGTSLGLIPGAELPEELAFAAAKPTVARAWASFAASVARAADPVLDSSSRAAIEAELAKWNGDDPPIGGGWLEEFANELDEPVRGAARLALAAALAPYRATEHDIARAGSGEGAAEVVAAAAWGALAAAKRVARWITPPEFG
ncbi:MAG: carboxymuconolactone decarboxylase family protein [Solirubrobacterales bacterium]